MARRYSLSAAGFLGGLLLAALLAGALLLATRDETVPQSGGAPFDGRECGSGFIEGGIVDYWDSGGTQSATDALAAAERSSLRREFRAVATARLTSASADRQVWTYRDRGDRSLGEITLERVGAGWRLWGSKQCALTVHVGNLPADPKT